MATVRYEIDPKRELTSEEENILESAAKKPVMYDEDLPKLSQEQLMQFYRISDARKEERRKQNVTLRLSPQAIRKAKALGKGYTSVLARILENALNDPDIIKSNL